MKRPYIQLGIGDLEKLFLDIPIAWPLPLKSVITLKQLEVELRYRQVPRAVALQEKVNAVLEGKADGQEFRPLEPLPNAAASTPSASASESGASLPQPDLFASLPVARVKLAATTSSIAAPATPSQIVDDAGKANPRLNTSSEPNQEMSFADALRLLKVSADASWEELERQRRALVLASAPSHTQSLTAESRSVAERQARLVNLAHGVIVQARVARGAI